MQLRGMIETDLTTTMDIFTLSVHQSIIVPCMKNVDQVILVNTDVKDAPDETTGEIDDSRERT